jgi:hypothetical protein
LKKKLNHFGEMLAQVRWSALSLSLFLVSVGALSPLSHFKQPGWVWKGSSLGRGEMQKGRGA